jgi:hypothetical protein
MENDRTHVGLTPVWSPLLVKEAGSLSGGHCQMEEREREERGREREKERQRERERTNLGFDWERAVGTGGVLLCHWVMDHIGGGEEKQRISGVLGFLASCVFTRKKKSEILCFLESCKNLELDVFSYRK